MRILIPVFNFGKEGGYRVLSQFANYWIKNNHEVTFICCHASIEPYYPTQANIIYVNKKGSQTSDLINPHSVSFIYRFFSLYNWLKKHNSNFDYVIANQSLTTFPVYLTFTSSKRVYYIQAYEPEMYLFQKNIKNYIFGFLSWISYFLKFKKIVNAPLYLNYKNIKADYFVYPGIDLNLFNRKNKINNKGELNIGCIGRIEKYKGTQYVFDAFNKIVETNKNCILNVAFGDNLIQHKNIRYIFPKNDKELADFYKEMDIIVASGMIQLGAVHYPVIESMACGTIVINTGYYPSSHINSWIVPIQNSSAIVDAINDILNSPQDVKNKTNIAFSQIQEFDWNVVSSKMIKILEKSI